MFEIFSTRSTFYVPPISYYYWLFVYCLLKAMYTSTEINTFLSKTLKAFKIIIYADSLARLNQKLTVVRNRNFNSIFNERIKIGDYLWIYGRSMWDVDNSTKNCINGIKTSWIGQNTSKSSKTHGDANFFLSYYCFE